MTSTVLDYQPARAEAPPPAAVPGRYTLLALLCLAAAIAYVQRSGISVAAGAIQGELGLDKVRFGTVLSAWSLGYALAQIPSGWLADRWGTRRTLTLYALLWSAATGLTGLATGYASLAALWTVMGVAQAGIFPCSTKAISLWFPVERRASSSGLLGSAMSIGGALAPALTGVLLTALAWRWVFVLYALPGIAWALLFYLWLGRSPGPAAPAAPAGSERGAWRRMLTSVPAWLLCAQQFLRAAAMIFFATWFPTYLREARGATLVQSGTLTTLALAGPVLGSLLGGLASDKLLVLTGSKRLSRQGIAVAGMAGCALLIVCAYFVADATLAVLVIGAGAFCGAFGGVSGYTVAMDLGGRRVATVFSAMNMCGNFGAALFPVLVGWLVQRTGNWDLVLFLFAGIFALAGVCWALLNPTRPLFEEEP